MKKVLFSLLLMGSMQVLLAQNEPTCYQKYATGFEKLGAFEVNDGAHEVVVSIRKGSYADCFVGKVKVMNGVVLKNSIQLSYVDGNYEDFDREYKFEDPITVINGMSKTMVTADDELVNVLFINKIKPKKKALKRAPEPDFDF